jgi:hypothetical protein
MKTKARILILFLLIGATTGLISCGDEDCPSRTFDTFIPDITMIPLSVLKSDY